MGEYLRRLFDAYDFIPRRYEEGWSPELVQLHVIANVLVWSAYLAILAILIYFVRRRAVPFPTLFWMFGAFIAICGLTHLLNVVTCYWPVYRFSSLLQLVMGIVGWVTVIQLVPVIPKALTLRSLTELEREVAERKQAETALRGMQAQLESLVAQRTAELARANEKLQEEVAERQRVEGALREQREWLHGVLSSIGDGVIATDTLGTVSFMNPVAEKLTGWRSGEAAHQPVENVFTIVHERMTDAPLAPPSSIRRRTIETDPGTPSLLVARDRSQRPIEENAAPIRDKQGQVLGAVFVFRDTTERRRWEQALQQSEEQYRFLAESIPQIVWTARPDGHTDYFNQRWFEYTGLTPEESCARDGWKAALHSDDVEMCLNRWYQAVRSGETYEIEYRFKRAVDGCYRWHLGRAVPMRDLAGRIIKWFGTCTDIDEQKRAQESLRKWELIFQFAGWGVAIVDPTNHDLLAVNPAFARMHGYAVGELLGWSLQELFAPGSGEDLPARAHQVHEQGHLVYQSVHRRKDGTSFPVLTDVATFTDASGKVLYRAANFQDITERKELEDRLLRQAEELVEANRLKDEFLAMLAHELRNPLAPLRNAVHMLRLRGNDPASLHWTAEVMERQVQHMTRMVADLLDVSRITRRKILLHSEPLDMVKVIHAVAEDQQTLLEEAQLALHLQLPREPVWVHGDATRLSQVTANLVQNAVKFTEAGGVITIRLVQDTVGQRCVCTVRDTGVGIGPDLLPHVFDTFIQADRSLARSQGGLGLGLALVKGLVELHGGGVSAESAGPGEGAEFSFWLPLTPAPVNCTRPPKAPAPIAHGLRIVMIEDSRDAADTLKFLLEMFGHEVAVAYSGIEGLELARSQQPDVVLCDLGLPGMDGFAVARALRRDQATAGTYLIAITGYSSESDRQRTREAGFDLHLAKPVDPLDLRQVLAELAMKEAPASPKP
jgi:PAS domain S-box-containing protein